MLMQTEQMEADRFYHTSNADRMISHPAPTPHYAFAQHADKWQGDVITQHFVLWDVSHGIPPQGPRDKYAL